MWNKKKIRFTDKKHSRLGIISSGLGGAALLLFAVSIAAAYIRSGQAGRIIAVTGFLAMLCACAGLYYGIMGYREEGTYRLFLRLGCGLNFLLLAGFVSIYILGW